MSTMSATKTSVTVARGLQVDCYDYSNHIVADISIENPQENDAVSDIISSSDGKHLAMITATSKKLIVYELPMTDKCRTYDLPRSASKIRFTADNQQILVADKTGDALIYSSIDSDGGTKLLGHLSLLLDILQTNDGKYIITSDRDEKIRVSCYPNTYSTHTYCLGHKEFVNHIELLPHDDKCLISTSGDGHVKIWDYSQGKLCYDIDTFTDINDVDLKDKFTKVMDLEGVEVNALPIVHFAETQLSEKSSLFAVAVHGCDQLLLYIVDSLDDKLSHKLMNKLSLNKFPAAIQFVDTNLFVYDDADSTVSIFKVTNTDEIAVRLDQVINMFKDKPRDCVKNPIEDNIKVLYKRKFDNVQEYQERKKLRLSKLGHK